MVPQAEADATNLSPHFSSSCRTTPGHPLLLRVPVDTPTRPTPVSRAQHLVSLHQSSTERAREQLPELLRNKEDFPAQLDQLRQLIEDKVCVLQSSSAEGVVSEETAEREGLRGFALLSQELTFHLQQLQKQTEQELSNVQTQIFQIEGHQQLLSTELLELQEKKKQTEKQCNQGSALQLCAFRELQTSITERRVQSERLVFQEEALSALRNLLIQDVQRYQEETQRLTHFTQKILKEETIASRQSENSTQGKSEMEQDNMLTRYSSSSRSPHQDSNKELSEQAKRAIYKRPVGLTRSSNMQRTGSVKELINKFSGPNQGPPSSSPQSLLNGALKSTSAESLESLKSTSSPSTPSSSSSGQDWSPNPIINVTPSFKESAQHGDELPGSATESSRITARIDCPSEASADKAGSAAGSKEHTPDSGRDSVADSGNGSESELESNKQTDSPSEEEPSTPKATPAIQNPKYELLFNNELKTNGLSGKDTDGPGSGGDGGGGSGLGMENGPRPLRWETMRTGSNQFRGSMESLNSREWDTTPDRLGVIDNVPRVFNSPYSTSMEYNPSYRMSDYKPLHLQVPGRLSPATSEMNLYSFNNRSTSPVGISSVTHTSRPRFSAYDTLRRKPENNIVTTTHYSLRSNTVGAPNKKNYIEELTKELDTCQKRNQFLEAESVEMEKERNQIRFEMRNLLVNNEDLLRTNTQLNNEMKRMREQMIEMDKENQSVRERFRELEIEVKQARDIMVEANNQEYAFNVLEQSLKNRIQDAEENLDKQTQHAQSLAEKLWLTERQLEELEADKDTKNKKSSELNSTILSLQTELSEAVAVSTQAAAEANLQQKLREDAQMRVNELEESLLEKDQELQKLQLLVNRLQGEVSGRLIDKERTLEEEIQLRERLQLQCRQAERAVDDLTMELHGTNQTKEDLAKQLKQAQEKLIDLEADVEELHDSEQRWAAKHKRAIEQMEQLQLKLIQEKDLNDQLELEKASTERQLREMRLEVEELQSSRVQEDVISRAESRVKELENLLRTEERNKATLTNTISKLERRINELSDQMEEEHRIATEQKDLMSQRIRSLKRQLNEAEEEASRKEAQYRHIQRELAEERESSSRLQRQLLDQHLQTKRMETLTIRQTLDNLRLDLDNDDEDEDLPSEQQANVTKV
ncbi:uncharacterized protein KZ484_021129 [Pholidichthys leucotaenia]